MVLSITRSAIGKLQNKCPDATTVLAGAWSGRKFCNQRSDRDTTAARGLRRLGWRRLSALGTARCAPYFVRLEADELFGHQPYHGDAGPIPIFRTPVEKWESVDAAFVTSSTNHGFTWTDDINAPGAEGVSRCPSRRPLRSRRQRIGLSPAA